MYICSLIDNHDYCHSVGIFLRVEIASARWKMLTA